MPAAIRRQKHKLTVVDNTPPVLTGVPADATVQCDAIPAAANCNCN